MPPRSKKPVPTVQTSASDAPTIADGEEEPVKVNLADANSLKAALDDCARKAGFSTNIDLLTYGIAQAAMCL